MRRSIVRRRIAFAALAVTLSSLALATSPVSAADKLRLGKSVGINWSFLAADVGVQEGIFAKYGLDVEVIAFGGDAKLQQALASGGVDFGLGSGPSMAFAVKGAPVIAVAAFAREPRNISIDLPAGSPVKTIADLKGRTLAVSTTGSLTDWLVKRVATVEGWGADGLRSAAIGDAPAQVAAMRSGAVDGMMGSTEYGIMLEERGEAHVLVGMERYAPHFVTHVIFAKKQMVAQQPELVERFLKAFFASLAFIKEHKARTTEIAVPIQNESAELLDKAYDYLMPMMVFDGEFDREGLELIKTSLVEMGTLDRKPEDDQILTRRFLPVKP